MDQLLKTPQQLGKHFKLSFFIFTLSIIIVSCVSKDHSSFKRIGKFNEEGLKDGKWQYFDSTGKLFQEGYFVNGLRAGTWFYSGTKTDSIFWRVHKSPTRIIEINFPQNISLVDDSDSLVVFKSIKDSEIFTLVVGRSFGSSLESYTERIYQDLINRNATLIDTSSQYIRTETGRSYLYNYIFGKDSNSGFYIFNIAGMDSEGYLIEITLRCDDKNENLARRVFFSIIPNLFIKQLKFFHIEDKVAEFKK
ncbi:hypothetical protein LZZ85_26350 [Terrimonas sp. NA20]|uniref:Lipoprotein n=1 Tax=Terrimonas ginsenosidimutans TaxID=2908004 RepID=A0ABS9KZW9_9BACT|nr:hypothetical protein [Terrimonas ginsenosidimutans]MCG2617850.1 hypothetical protein [Terrimonas ginsenosidimutans]